MPPRPPPRPGVILLDLNMPRKNGREALTEIKADPLLRPIPVLILTTSTAEADITRTYCGDAAWHNPKPVTFEPFIKVMKTTSSYCFDIVQLPAQS